MPWPPGMSPGKRAAEAEAPVVTAMAAESDPRVLEEIRALEQRLAVLRDREQMPTPHVPEVPEMPGQAPAQASDVSWVREEAHRRENTAEAAP